MKCPLCDTSVTQKMSCDVETDTRIIHTSSRCREVQDANKKKLTSRCELCGKPCQSWQRFCGAHCVARYEAGERPKQ